MQDFPKPAEGRAYRGQALAERVAARRAQFIEAGLTLFGTQGLRATTVRGVCAQAGLTDRYFYESFDSLEALLTAVYSGLMDGLASAVRALDDQPHAGWQARASAGYALWFQAVRDPRVARIVLTEVLGVSPALDALYEQGMQAFADMSTAPMLAALPAGRLPPAQRALIGRALVGASIHVARLWVQGGYREPQAEVVRSCALVAVGTLQALMAEAPPKAAPVAGARAQAPG